MTLEEYYERGAEFKKNGDWDNAIKIWTQVISMYPDDGSAYYNRGLTYSNKKDNVRAISDYTDAIRLVEGDSNLALAYYNRGLEYKIKGIYFKAIEDFKMVCSLDPYDREAKVVLQKTKDEQARIGHNEKEKEQKLNDEIKKEKNKEKNKAVIYDSNGDLRIIDTNSADAYYTRAMAYKELEYYYNAIGK